MKFAGGFTGSMSGSLGGITASHNRGGAYLRNRSIPVQPNTPRQQAAKTAMGELVQAWPETLTDGQRQGWRDYAAAVPRTDPLGQLVTLTGQQMYIAANAPRLSATNLGAGPFARVDDAPAILDTGQPPADVTQFDVTSGTNSLNMTITIPGGASDDGQLFFYIGRPLNPGSNFFKGPYQFATSIAVTSGDTTLNATPDTAAWFSETVIADADVGKRYPLRLIIAYDDGRTSQQLRIIKTLASGI